MPEPQPNLRRQAKVSANESKSKMKDVVFRFAFAECSQNLLKVSANESKSKQEAENKTKKHHLTINLIRPP